MPGKSIFGRFAVLAVALGWAAWVGSTQAVETGARPPAAGAKERKGQERAAEARRRPDELLVKFRAGVGEAQIEAIAASQGAAEVKRFRRPKHQRAGAAIERWRHFRVPPGRDLEQAVAELRQNPAVERVEPNFEVRPQITPDDPRFPEQWALQNTGQTGGSPDADIDAPEAWDVANGSEAIIVAVIDTGVDAAHPDLAANMWVNPGEIPGNGVDDDGNGYVDDVHGYDFKNNDADPSDDYGHGTHVAGIIAAAGNNATGVSGVAWRARIMSVKFLGADGYGLISDAVNAVLYAADNGARVMNNSWGGGGFSQALLDAIEAANEAGILFVAAAGNYTSDNDAFPFYPAAYDAPNVAAIAAGDKWDQPAWFTNYGRRSVLMAAPGQDVLSSVPAAGDPCCSDPSGYKLLSGTSMAAPHVSGAAALLLAQDPARTASNLVPLLFQTVDSAAAGVITRTYGRLNVGKAARCDTGTLSILMKTPDHGFVAFTGEPFAIAALVHACGYPVAGASVVASFNNGDAPVTLLDDGAHGDGAANDGVYGASWVPQSISSQLTLEVSASDPARGAASLTRSGLVRKRITYRYEPAAFDWIDASGGTRPTLNWYGSAAVALPFGFEFYGQTYSTVFLYRNGFLSVYGPGGDTYWPTRLPDPETIDGVIAPHWTGPYSLSWGPDTRMYVLADGAAPARRVTVAWLDFVDANGAPVSFQATLREGANDIVFQYLSVPDQGAGAAVGVENQDATEGTQHSAFTPSLQNGMALRFHPGPFNRAPGAHPGGPYTGLPAQAIAFDGTGSTDAENDALTYRWSFGDGATATGARPLHTYAAKGTYTATLVVNDGIHDSQPASTTVTVQNRPPIAIFSGPATGQRGYAVTFDARPSHDFDGDELQIYRWSFGDATPDYTAYKMPTTQHMYSQLGTFTVTLVVNDGFDDSAPASMTVTVSNVPPTADAGPDITAAPRTNVYLTSHSRDVDGQLVQYQWRQLSGPAVTLSSPNGAQTIFTAPNAKAGSPLKLEFELTVTDNDGAQASDRVVVTVVK